MRHPQYGNHSHTYARVYIWDVQTDYKLSYSFGLWTLHNMQTDVMMWTDHTPTPTDIDTEIRQHEATL